MDARSPRAHPVRPWPRHGMPAWHNRTRTSAGSCPLRREANGQSERVRATQEQFPGHGFQPTGRNEQSGNALAVAPNDGPVSATSEARFEPFLLQTQPMTEIPHGRCYES